MTEAGKLSVGIVGSGNIGTDLCIKIIRSNKLSLRWMVGIDKDSPGLARARSLGVTVGYDGLERVLMDDGAPKVVFDATSASSHSNHVELIEGRDIRCIDLTPAALGPGVVPDVNLSEHADAKDMSLVTCAAQATVPIVAGLAQVMDVGYVETVSTIASRSAGPGTRNNIDEFTFATSRALETIGGAKRGKASVILNPADPPITMRNTIVVELDVGTAASATERTEEVVHRLQAFVPGYALAGRPSVGEDTLTIFTSVTGAGDFLPPFAGNLDIMTSAAVRVAESLADESIHL